MDNKLKEIHEAYLLCQKVFAPSVELTQKEFEIADEDELLFYNHVSEFFLQKKQREYLSRG